MNIILKRNGGRGALVPYYSPLSLMNELEALASELWDSWRPIDFVASSAPRTDVYEEKGKLVVKTELPRIKSEDLDVKLEGDTLTIKAEKKAEVEEDATHHARDRYYGQYYRSVTLPFPVKEDKVTATLDDGVLEIKLPKAEEIEAKKIEVKAQLPKAKSKSKKEK